MGPGSLGRQPRSTAPAPAGPGARAGRAGHVPPAVGRAVAWLEGHQKTPEWGWGEDLRSYRDDSHAATGRPTASQIGLGPVGAPGAGERSGAAQRGVAFLRRKPECEDGSWDEPWFTGNRIPGRLLHQLSLYRLVFPVAALGRFVNGEPHG